MKKALTYLKDKSKYLILAMLAAVLFASPRFLTIRYSFGICTFAALVLFLVLSVRAESRCDLIALEVFFVISLICRHLGTAGLLVDVLVYGILGVCIFQAFKINRFAQKRKDGIISTLAFPVAWMILAVIVALLRFPAVMRLEWLFSDTKYLIQSVLLITSYGFTFLVVWTATLVAGSITKHNASGAIIAGGILALMMGFGIIKIAAAPKQVNSVRVAYTTGPYVGDFNNCRLTTYEEAIESLDKSSKAAAGKGAQILTFCEESFGIEDVREAEFVAHAKETARENKLHILLGLEITNSIGNNNGKDQNKLVWIDSDGNERGTYLKFETIPIMEYSYLRGDGDIPVIDIDLDGEQVAIAYAICYDSNHTIHMNQIKNKADILFLPSWDWDGVDVYHYRLCESLAAELETSLIKSTYDGYSIVCDRCGNITHITHSDEIGYENVQIVDIPY